MGLKERRKKIVAQIQALAEQYPADKARNALLQISVALEDAVTDLDSLSNVLCPVSETRREEIRERLAKQRGAV